MTQMDDATNPYQLALAVNHGRRATLWQRWRTPTSVLLMLIGTFCSAAAERAGVHELR